MKKFLSTHRLHLFIIFAITAAISINLLRIGFVFGGAEEGIPFFNIQRTIQIYSNIWVDQVPGYPLIFEVGKIPFLFFLLGVSKITASTYLVSSVYIFTLMSLGAIGMYAFSLLIFQNHSRKPVLSLWAALFYLLNPFSMSQIWGRHLSMQMYPFALFPGFLALLFYGLQKRKFLYAAIAVLFSAFLAGAFNHPSYVISLFLVVLLYSIFHFTTRKKERIYLVSYLIRTGILFIFANCFWLLPYIVQLKEPNNFVGNNENLSILMGLSQYFPLSTILTLKQKYYFNIAHAFGSNYDSMLFLAVALIFPALLIVGFSKVKKLQKTEALFVSIGFLFALFICAGGNRPFGSIILWLVNHFTILEVFRNTYEKFGLVLTLFYAILFSLGLQSTKDYLDKKRAQLLFWPLIIILFFVYLLPIWNGSAFQQSDTTNKPPEYYNDFLKWADGKTANSRMLFTPIMNGDATTQQWGEQQYRGVDITPYILSGGSLTRELPGTPGSEFTQELRKRIQQQNTSDILKSLRVKYLVDRGDIIANQAFTNHINFLTQETYPPSKRVDELCSNFKAGPLTTNIFYSCTPKSPDFRNIKYLHLGITTNTKVMIETRLLDKNGLRSRWDGKTEKGYLIDQNTHELILPLGIETELPEKFLYSDVVAIEVSYFPVDGYINPSVHLNAIKSDKGEKVFLNEYRPIEHFGKLTVYASDSTVFDEVRAPQDIIGVSDLNTLFTTYKADKNKTYVITDDSNGFMHSSNSIVKVSKASDTKYVITLNSSEPAYIWFGKNMNSSWKIVPINLKNDIDIFKYSFVPEQQHFTADGYANLWKVQGSSEYTIVYLPALYVRLGSDISIGATLLIGFYVLVTFKRKQKNKL